MDSNRQQTVSSTEEDSADQPKISAPPVESQNDLVAAGLAANSSVGQQSNLAKDSDSPEVRFLREKLRLTQENLSELRGQLTQTETLNTTLVELKDLQNTTMKNLQVFVDELKHLVSRKDEYVREAERKLVDSESLKSQYFQLYTEESAKLTTVEQQLECEKEKNRQKDQIDQKQQKELTEKSAEINSKSAEIHNKTGEILKLRQTAQSLKTQLKLKSDENLTIKSAVKSALETELSCSICSRHMIEVVVLCGHTFCKKCIDEWMNKGNETCPYCRSECDRSEPIVAIQQLQAKLLSCVNDEQPIVTQSNGENLPIRNNNNGSWCVSM